MSPYEQKDTFLMVVKFINKDNWQIMAVGKNLERLIKMKQKDKEAWKRITDMKIVKMTGDTAQFFITK